MPNPDLYLASRSPRRRELLQQMGLRFTALEVEVDEVAKPGEEPAAFVQRLALEKARAGWFSPLRRMSAPVLGADTVVVVDDEILGKPVDCSHAMTMLGKLSDRSHRVLSAVSLVWDDRTDTRLNVSTVWFRILTESERERYCETGEPLDKAGGYAIQGRAAAFISRLEGSYSGVMGLPLYETAELLESFGCRIDW